MNNYELILDILADKIKDNEATIALMKWQIEDLKKKLAEAEALLPSKKTINAKLEIR